MNKKILMLSLGLGIFLVGCQTDSVTEELPTNEVSVAKESKDSQVNKIHEPGFTTTIHEPGLVEGPGANIHEPGWMEGPGINIHEPGWVAELAWFACGEDYTGSSNLTINKNKPSAYSSAEDDMVVLKNLNIGGDLSFCGLLAVENTLNIHRAGVFDFAGEMFIGTEEVPADLVINSGAHLNFAGKIIVTGDLIINRGATVEIYGEGHDVVFEVGGNIEVSDDAIILDKREHDHEH